MDLRDIINSIYPISEKSMDRVLSCSLELGRPKGHRLLEAGKIESDIFFIKRGIVRAYVLREGKDITFWIGKEGATIMSLKSYVKNEAGYETIELMEDSLLYCLKRSDLYRLFEEDIDIANWGRKLAELEFLRAEEKLIPLLFTTASERFVGAYSRFVTKNSLRMSCLVFGNYSCKFKPYKGEVKINWAIPCFLEKEH